VLGACAAQEASTAAPPRTTAASNQHPGEQIYVKSCARCHGENFEGRRGEPGIDGAKLATLGDQRLRLTISTGKGKMPGFSKLSQSQVDALISYLKAAA
jgi:quinoprotein glucose dehydrogenase